MGGEEESERAPMAMAAAAPAVSDERTGRRVGRHRRRGSSATLGVVFVVATAVLVSVYSSAAVAAVSHDPTNNNNINNSPDWVSPLVNREIRTSIQATGWPSAPHAVLCEAYALLLLRNDETDDTDTHKDDDHQRGRAAVARAYFDRLAQLVELDHDPKQPGNLSMAKATDWALQAAAAVTPSLVPWLSTMVALRAASPFCETHRQLAIQHLHHQQQSVEISSSSPSPTHTNVFLATVRQSTLLPDDIVFHNNEGKDDNASVTVLYANLGTMDFVHAYQTLKDSYSVPFVIRHFHNGGILSNKNNNSNTVVAVEPEMPLQGYGVRLDIRNVEYKVFDDRKTSLPTNDNTNTETTTTNLNMDNRINVTTAVQSVGPPKSLAGVNLTCLMEHASWNEAAPSSDNDATIHRRSLSAALWRIHDEQMARQQLVPPVWQRRHLPLQAATVIFAESTSQVDPLFVLQHVAQNLPSVASTLVHVKVPPQISAAAAVGGTQNTKHAKRSAPLRPGRLYFNGRMVASLDRPTFNVFEVMNQLRSEQVALERWYANMEGMLLPLLQNKQTKNNNTASVRAALSDIRSAWMMGRDFWKSSPVSEQTESKNAVSSSDEDSAEDGGDLQGQQEEAVVRIDVGHGWKEAIIYLNDIEKDITYAQWTTSMQQMLMMTQYGMPPTVRRNLFTIMAVMDPITGDENSGLVLGLQLAQSSYPARMGVLVVAQSDVDQCMIWLSSSDSKSSEACPVNSLFAKPIPDSVEDLRVIPATTQAVHRLLAHFAENATKENPAALISYADFLVSSIREQKEQISETITMFDLVNIHGHLMVGMHMSSQEEGLEDAFSILTSDESSDLSQSLQHQYGMSVRFAVDKRLYPGMSFLNGRPLPVDPADASLGQIFGEEQNYVFGLIVKGDITDRSPKSVYAKLLSGEGVHKKFHKLLSQSQAEEGAVTHKQVNHGFTDESLMVSNSNVSSLAAAGAVFVLDAYLDYTSPNGQSAASSLISALSSFPSAISTSTKIGIVFRILPSTESALSSILCPVLSLASLLTPQTVQKALELASLDKNIASLELLLDALGDVPIEVREKIHSTSENGDPCSNTKYLTQLPIASRNSLVANGRVYEIDGSVVNTDDIELLLTLESPRAKSVTSLMRNHLSLSSPEGVAVVGQIATFLALEEATDSGRINPVKTIEQIQQGLESKENPLYFSWNTNDDDEALKVKWTSIYLFKEKHGTIILPLDPFVFQVQVVAIVDPVSEATQRLSPLLTMFRDKLKLPLHVLLTPALMLDGDAKIPISSYYRFVADPSALSDETIPQAVFSNLPVNHVLTLQVDVPEPWNVQQTAAVQDTDNMLCDVVSGCSDEANDNAANVIPVHERDHVTTVEYGLKNLLIFGQCYDSSTRNAPNGLQLTLTRAGDGQSNATISDNVEIGIDGSMSGDSSDPVLKQTPTIYSDTLVMKTVGYWQLPANPGVWKIGIEESSKGAEIFEIVSGSIRNGRITTEENATQTSKMVIMKDFASKSEVLLVRRRQGFEFSSVFHDSDNKTVENADDEVINVFSLATGHLYERFLKIMMLSVTKRTSSKVKFWLFENFLSPTFKASARAMADRIGCDVEFVTYKWPEWLRGQSEKQRIIWGYKVRLLCYMDR